MQYLLEENPRRRRHSRRNPAAALKLPVVGNVLGGANPMDIVVGAGTAIAATTMSANFIAKGVTTLSMQQKLLRLAVSIGVTLGIGMLARNFLKGSTKAAIFGGLVGTTVQAVSNFSDGRWKIAGSSSHSGYALPFREVSPQASNANEASIITNVT